MPREVKVFKRTRRGLVNGVVVVKTVLAEVIMQEKNKRKVEDLPELIPSQGNAGNFIGICRDAQIKSKKGKRWNLQPECVKAGNSASVHRR